ncbi:MAG: AAA family ATPase [Candidatus Sulfotelmatobacter sp.]
MVGFVGVTGLSGSGKTTAVEYLSRLTSGRILYLGQTVLDEVRARGLSETRDNERHVRIDLRRERGPAALAIPHVNWVAECVENGMPIFVDAIFNQEEFNVLAYRIPSGFARLLAIDASLAIRSARLACRPERPFNVDELRERDKTELEKLGTAAVMAAAEHTIRNEETLDEFYRRLAAFVSCCA